MILNIAILDDPNSGFKCFEVQNGPAYKVMGMGYSANLRLHTLKLNLVVL